MEWIGEMIAAPLGWLMWVCYLMVKDYGLAIILFTGFTKVILLPLSIWVQKLYQNGQDTAGNQLS
jgi:YidC/Oxa1 family membrane protein insertase